MDATTRLLCMARVFAASGKQQTAQVDAALASGDTPGAERLLRGAARHADLAVRCLTAAVCCETRERE